jgi:hypothetical protein
MAFEHINQLSCDPDVDLTLSLYLTQSCPLYHLINKINYSLLIDVASSSSSSYTIG